VNKKIFLKNIWLLHFKTYLYKMSYRYNSTIKIKHKPCSRCGKVGPIFSKGRCQQCATIENTLAKMEDDSERLIKEEGLQDLIKQADEVFSRWLRLSGSDKEGNVSCFTCGVTKHWTFQQNGHYIKRGNLFLRFDPRNCRVQCEGCNVYKDGNYSEYTQRLEAERPGITEYLLEESRIAYKPTRDEIKGIIKEYRLKLKLLKNG